jgi:pseudouridine synthase
MNNRPDENRPEIRLNRFLAQSGLGSRRECDRLIASGKVAVNGQRITELATRVDPSRDKVTFEGKPVKPANAPEYVAYHKSRGSVVTANDPQGRESIYDALKKCGYHFDHLRYIGRLDRNSEGLILLTNDGDLIHALTHPRFQVKKTYRVRVDKALKEEDARRMVEEGIESEGQLLHAGAVRQALSAPAREFWYELDLYEGKNRQVRRMLEALGYQVRRLKRIQFGVIKLRDLSRGHARHLQEREVKGLKNLGYPPSKSARKINAQRANRSGRRKR